ncbi:unnamed protein product [Adineta steineri]|uniref:Uncharacterized protein n=4 Tax=Adineta steineri TaxID=433720 RepID=A0A818Z2Q2_9BILA|nr:unnamed protein product [Adineta steineri]CAF1098588.1 unnamed protein product [Adineta steineri]CAF3758203.1 unnamed protein product [Adineta steineri]
MSTQNTRKISSIVRSIEVIENKANTIYTEYTTSHDDIDRFQSILIDDKNIHLQMFFQHLEKLLEVDLKNRKSLLNNKRNYWDFFIHALKESKGLYDTILYVLNSQEVKTSIGRGRLFLRFCLQNHRLGDVIQQSFMMNKVVSQFYHDECFWTKSVYINRIVQALYQLNDVQFDLLSTSQYQLDVCWPTTESIDIRPKNLSESLSRLRTNSISSCLSMDSISSQSIISSSFPLTLSSLQNFESSMHDDSLACSISSTDEYPENTLNYWKERCHQLELQLQTNSHNSLSNDIEIQCSVDKHDAMIQTVEDDSISKNEIENWKIQNDVLKDEINNLNFQLSTFIIQRTTTENKIKDSEREITKYQTLLETKDKVYNELQRKFNEHVSHLKSIQEQHSVQSNQQEKRLEQLTNELKKTTQLLENERILIEKERSKHNQIQDQLEASIQEKTLDFEEMKRRLVKAVREKADLFNSIYSYEIKLEEEQSRQWVHEEDVLKCTKCETTFGWTLKKYRCRHCQKIFCYYCSNHWQPGSTPNTQHRLCDFCNEKFVKESLMSNYTMLDDPDNNNETKNDVDLKFEVRSERLNSTTNDNSPLSEDQQI